MSGNFDKDELFSQLYDKYKEPLRYHLISLGVLAQLDDIIQEAFMRLYTRICGPGEPIERDKLGAYLYVVAKNIALDKHRHDKRVSKIEISVDDAALQSIADTAPLPDEVYDEIELQERFNKAIEKLPKKMAEAVKGLLDGKKFGIIAQEIGIQIPALRHRLREAKALLQREMDW